MPLQIVATYDAEAGLDRDSIVISDTPAELTANQIGVYALADVSLRRQNEIINGWKWLFDGVRERNLIDDGGAFAGAVLYTYASIDSLTVGNRRTSSALIDLNADDVGIGMGTGVTAGANGRTMQLDNAFGFLAEHIGRKALADNE